MAADPSLERWKKFLHYDPTRWLLETNDPSILLWYQLDIAHRPEDAPGVLDMRERVLFSDPVQKLLAQQNELGYWGEPESLVEPKYKATLWNLVLLAELGIPRSSRRARNGCEFVLQNFVNEDGTFREMELPECGYALYALGYFMRHDPRVERIALASLPYWKNTLDDDGTTPALLAWGQFQDDPSFAEMIYEATEEELNTIWNNGFYQFLGFPHLFPYDPLFALRVLAVHNRVHDERAGPLVQWLLGFQDSLGRFPLTETMDTSVEPPLESISTESRWVTLNALRVITKLVQADQK
jgi:hypothetical protein